MIKIKPPQKKINSLLSGIGIFLSVFLSTPLQAQIKPDLQVGTLFQDHMLLQREKPVRIWGKAIPGAQVVVTMGDKSTSIKAGANGKWVAELPAFQEKGPYSINISSGKNLRVIKDVLVGDVWIASGQSNMEWPISGTNYHETDSSWVDSAEIRLIKIRPEMDYEPQEEGLNNGWQKLSLNNIDEFSAVAYHFGKYLYQNTGVPIGLISANLGATAIETWMSNDALSGFPQFEVEHSGSFEELKNAFEDGTADWSKETYYSGKGMKEKWFNGTSTDPAEWKSIEVAGNTWEAVEDLKDFDGAVWFRKDFDLPKDFSGDSLNLQLIQIDDNDITWVNGKKVGETFGRHNHRNYKVAVSDLKKEDNLLVVRVFDAGGIGGFTTNPFWGNELLWGTWEYRKGMEIEASRFSGPDLPNATPFSSPGVLFNGTIAPLTRLGLKGVIWYQGESNELRAHEYGSLFPALIRDWRDKFDQDNFPFLFVQLANYRQETHSPNSSLWAELREAQSLALKEPNTGMAVAIDLGEAHDIHPKNKEEVGKRLGMLALDIAYDQELLARSPQFREVEFKNGKAAISLKHLGTGMVNKNKYGYIRGFQIAGSDREFHWAQARMQDNKLLVWSPEVEKPVAVRYAWSDNPGPADLYNSAGLPLAPFRTDDWSLETEGVLFKEGPRF